MCKKKTHKEFLCSVSLEAAESKVMEVRSLSRGHTSQQLGLLPALMEALLSETKALGCFASALLMIGCDPSHVDGVN